MLCAASHRHRGHVKHLRFGARGRRARALPPGARLSAVGAQLREDPARFERALDFALRATHLPPFVRQYRFAPPRQFKADFACETYRLLVEVQGGIWKRGGGAHSHPLDIEREIERQQHMVYHGWFMLPVTTDAVTDGSALSVIERALRARGWSP